MKLGAHQSIEGGYVKALDRIKNIGGNCLQIFSTSPRGWNYAKIENLQISQFLEKKTKLKIDPVYFHASYLINLADESKVSHLSKLSIMAELNAAEKLNIKGTIVHLGSFKRDITKEIQSNNIDPYETLTIHIKEILENTPKDTLFIIENAGNKKIGKDLAQIATIIEQVDNERVRVCLDTCHLFSAGYDLSTLKKLEDFLLAFDTLIGLEKLELFHANDSRDPFNSGRDRHENIGKGTVPLNTFKLLLNHPKTRNLPFIIETPGFDDKGPDKKNLDILKSLTKQ